MNVNGEATKPMKWIAAFVLTSLVVTPSRTTAAFLIYGPNSLWTLSSNSGNRIRRVVDGSEVLSDTDSQSSHDG